MDTKSVVNEMPPPKTEAVGTHQGTKSGISTTTDNKEVATKEDGKLAGKNKRRTFKIIVIGDSGVGKTCLTYRFCSGKFPSSTTDATIGVDFREKILTIDGVEQVRLQLWDTAGQERFRKSMVAHYYRNVSAVVLVYDVTRSGTFEGLKHWIEECQRHGLTSSKVPMLVVGNKCDGSHTDPTVVPTTVAQRFADDHNMPLFETSAKDDSKSDHVEAIFLTLAHKIKANKPLFDALPGQKEAEQETVNVIHTREQQVEESCCF